MMPDIRTYIKRDRRSAGYSDIEIVYDNDKRLAEARRRGVPASAIGQSNAACVVSRRVLPNPQAAQATFQSKTTIDMGGAVRRAPKSKRAGTGRAHREGPTDFYDVLFYDPYDNNKVFRRSPGICDTGDDRYLSMAKFYGLSVKAYKPSRLFKTRKEAAQYERKALAALDKDPAWEKTGKETYKPIKGMTA
jgi:hypothetical protein